MALTGKGRLLYAETSRTLIYLSQKVVNDSAFPFKGGDRLMITIDEGKLVVERAQEKANE